MEANLRNSLYAFNRAKFFCSINKKTNQKPEFVTIKDCQEFHWHI